MLILWIALGFAAVYAFLQGYYLVYWSHTPTYIPASVDIPSHGVSIVIVAHNEAKNIHGCIQSILNQKYLAALFEIIIVDDHSSDETIDKIRAIANEQVHYFQLKDFPEYIHAPAFKKSGITLAVDKAKHEHILVIDADCVFGEDWLSTTVNAFVQNKSVFQTGPVVLPNKHDMLEKMQEVEQLTLMLITGAGITSGLHDIANGANMIFAKAAFKEINGYEGNYKYASGDDMFLIEKMRAAFPNGISFLKSDKAIVYTEGKKTWEALIAQRLRWAGKNKGLKSKVIINIWSFIGLYHFLLLLTFATAVLALIPWKPFVILLLVKWFADYFVIKASASFFNRTDLLKLFIPLQVFYFWYIISLSLAMGLGKKSDWRREA